ncbi:hypothetical protein H6F67_04675 [Microcoleus sp. FACHB-1515]|uniref:hypothetical protein n=1 Tax=Cyanophyceae TaxID=3028117 RepID=UPI0016875B1F|nr:hypothetical protein [Microcoleus sp. FACHB-1515]MBD2089146.1 hypothetical protein [Microcoleus sp. FACHB-1515]
MKHWKRWLVVLLSMVTIACGPAPSLTSPSVESTTPVEIPAAPIDSITTYLSEQTQIPSAELRVDRVEAVNWPDSCLGLAQPTEMCAQAITPGFQVELSARNQRFVVRSDRTGRSIRLEP